MFFLYECCIWKIKYAEYTHIDLNLIFFKPNPLTDFLA